MRKSRSSWSLELFLHWSVAASLPGDAPLCIPPGTAALHRERAATPINVPVITRALESSQQLGSLPSLPTCTGWSAAAGTDVLSRSVPALSHYRILPQLQLLSLASGLSGDGVKGGTMSFRVPKSICERLSSTPCPFSSSCGAEPIISLFCSIPAEQAAGSGGWCVCAPPAAAGLAFLGAVA